MRCITEMIPLEMDVPLVSLVLFGFKCSFYSLDVESLR